MVRYERVLTVAPFLSPKVRFESNIPRRAVRSVPSVAVARMRDPAAATAADERGLARCSAIL